MFKLALASERSYLDKILKISSCRRSGGLSDAIFFQKAPWRYTYFRLQRGESKRSKDELFQPLSGQGSDWSNTILKAFISAGTRFDGGASK